MGSWGVKLNENDFAEDIRAQYKNKLSEGISNEMATNQLIADYEGILDNVDDGPNFWFVLADEQWRLGRLLPLVKKKTLEWIEKGGDLEIWYEESKNLGDARRKVLENLKTQIESPQPKEKKVQKKKYYICPWKIGDVFAYPLAGSSAEENHLIGKYIMFQVGAKRKLYKSGEICPVVRCWIVNKLIFSPEDKHCIQWNNIRCKYGNYGYMIYTKSSKSIPKNLIFLGNFKLKIPSNDSGDIEIQSEGVSWKFFEEMLIGDYLKNTKQQSCK